LLFETGFLIARLVLDKNNLERKSSWYQYELIEEIIFEIYQYKDIMYKRTSFLEQSQIKEVG